MIKITNTIIALIPKTLFQTHWSACANPTHHQRLTKKFVIQPNFAVPAI